MKLYHGTSAGVARLSLTEGLVPRGERKSNWEIESRDDLVYMTAAYAPYFALCTEDADEFGIIEIDTDLLDSSLFLPDEDFMEQATRDIGFPEGSMEERTQYFRDHLEEFADFWQRSVQGLGNCAYRGSIPTEAITGVITFDAELPQEVKFSILDPSISILNYAFCGGKYRDLTQWFFGKLENEEDQFVLAGMMPSLTSIPREGVEVLR